MISRKLRRTRPVEDVIGAEPGAGSNGVPSADAWPVGVAVAVGALRRAAPFGGLQSRSDEDLAN